MDVLLRQLLQLGTDLRAVGGAQCHGLGALVHRPVHQGQALCHVPLGISADVHRHVVVPAFLPEAGHSRLHLAPDIITDPAGLDEGQPPGGAAHGQGAGHAVGPVFQLLHDLEHPLPDLGLHIGPVMEHPVHRADGHPRLFRDHLDGSPHGLPPLSVNVHRIPHTSDLSMRPASENFWFFLSKVPISQNFCIQTRFPVLYYIRSSVESCVLSAVFHVFHWCERAFAQSNKTTPIWNVRDDVTVLPTGETGPGGNRTSLLCVRF